MTESSPNPISATGCAIVPAVIATTASMTLWVIVAATGQLGEQLRRPPSDRPRDTCLHESEDSSQHLGMTAAGGDAHDGHHGDAGSVKQITDHAPRLWRSRSVMVGSAA